MRQRTGQMSSYHAGEGTYAPIKDSEQRQQPKPPEFEARIFFYDVAYPYWQQPYHNGPYVQAQFVGVKADLRQAGYVGAPLPASDYQGPTQTTYGIPRG